MNLFNFKYVVIIVIALTLFLKVSNTISYLKYSLSEIEYASVNDDAAEKEEKKIETEYFTDQFFFNEQVNLFLSVDNKVIIPNHFFQLSYFPEVLTPPPSI
jgi:hypothetical protein